MGIVGKKNHEIEKSCSKEEEYGEFVRNYEYVCLGFQQGMPLTNANFSKRSFVMILHLAIFSKIVILNVNSNKLFSCEIGFFLVVYVTNDNSNPYKKVMVILNVIISRII